MKKKRNIPQTVPSKTEPDKVYRFNPKQRKFLEHYAATFDIGEACKVSGVRREAIYRNPYLEEEVGFIDQCANLAHRSKSALGNHHRLMRKFEKTYDTASFVEDKAKIMPTLAKMSEASMKAEGFSMTIRTRIKPISRLY